MALGIASFSWIYYSPCGSVGSPWVVAMVVKGRQRVASLRVILWVRCLLLLTVSSLAHANSFPHGPYRAEFMWPTLQQPWYFAAPVDVATDASGNVYMLELRAAKVVKYTAEGQFIQSWGVQGTGPGELQAPASLALDSEGNVYIADRGHRRVLKFSNGGDFLWGAPLGIPASSTLDFTFRPRIAVGAEGMVVVMEGATGRLHTYRSSDGVFLGFARLPGFERGGIAALPDGSFLAAGSDTSGVIRFSIDPKVLRPTSAPSLPFDFVTRNTPVAPFVDIAASPSGAFSVLGSTLDGQGTLQIISESGQVLASRYLTGAVVLDLELFGILWPSAVAVGPRGRTFVINNGVQIYDPAGIQLAEWSRNGDAAGRFNNPVTVLQNGFDHLHVVDVLNNRIQVFEQDGTFVRQYGSVLPFPLIDMAFEPSGSILVSQAFVDFPVRFSATGQFMGLFHDFPGGVAFTLVVASDGTIYADGVNGILHRYGAEGADDFGAFQNSFASRLDERVPYLLPTLSNDERFVFVLETDIDRVTRVDVSTKERFSFGSTGSGPGQFKKPSGLGIGPDGRVYVADFDNHRIQVFTEDGQFIEQIGEFGTGLGQMQFPMGRILVQDDHSIVFTDSGNSRVQRMVPSPLETSLRAVIVAAGGPYPGNSLWDATQFCANFAYRALSQQGLTKADILYLSDVSVDLDGNGLLDEVSGDVTLANLEQAITGWASGGENILIYLVDHGGPGTFRVSATEVLEASELAGWLDTLQANISGTLAVVYDACDSGSFVPEIAAPGRIVMTSARNAENAYFLSAGTVSFSSFFWTEVFNGATLGEAFAVARDAVAVGIAGLQNPLLDDNGNGIPNEPEDGALADAFQVGLGRSQAGSVPEFAAVSPPQTLSSGGVATLFADPEIPGRVSRVWAVVRPPGYMPLSTTNAVIDLPIVEMFPTTAQRNRWEGSYSAFSVAGDYQISLYARDDTGNTSRAALTTVTVESPLARRAILVAGEAAAKANPVAVRNVMTLARASLQGQGYAPGAVRVYGPAELQGVAGAGTLANLEDALTSWAQMDALDLVIYFVGHASADGLSLGTDLLTPLQLSEWLDGVQAAIPGRITVIIDADNAGAFVQALAPPAGKERIVLASTAPGETAAYFSEGAVSYSNYFWIRVLNGAHVEQAHLHAASAIRFASGQRAQIDDNGNGIPNEAADGLIARTHTIGAGVLLAGDDPVIGHIDEGYELGDATSVVVGAEGVTTTGTVTDVFVYVGFIPPDRSLKATPETRTLSMEYVGNGRYEATVDDLVLDGTYEMSVVARDTRGSVSFPIVTRYTKKLPHPPGIPNDSCAQSIAIETGVPMAGTTTNATGSATSGCAYGDSLDAWYRWTPAESGMASISLCGAFDFDTTLAIYTRCGVAPLACNDDFCGHGSAVCLPVTAGNEYRIRVAGFAGATGTFTLTASMGCEGMCAASPHPLDDPIYRDVIGLDASCCNNAWDSSCQGLYDTLAAQGPDCAPSPHDTDDAIYQRVITQDAFCCAQEWDGFCQGLYDALAPESNCVETAYAYRDPIYLAVLDASPGCCQHWGFFCEYEYNRRSGACAPSPYLDSDPIYQNIVKRRPSCCYAEWSESCQHEYDFFATGECSAPPHSVDDPILQQVLSQRAWCCTWWSDDCQALHDVFSGQTCPSEPPYPPSDPILAEVVAWSGYCCYGEWREYCQRRYDVISSGTCAESPHDADDPAYQQVIAEDSRCCEEEWNAGCQSRYELYANQACVDALYDSDDPALQRVIERRPWCCYWGWSESCQSLYSAYSTGVCGTAPYPADDPILQELISLAPVCCAFGQWVCQDIYDWIAQGKPCAESPYPPDDEIYQQVIAQNYWCCSDEWDGYCQREYDYLMAVSEGDGPEPPTNERCSNALEVRTGVPVHGSDILAGWSNLETAIGWIDGPQLWYRWRPEESGAARISTCEGHSDIDTRLAVFDACGGRMLAYNDDACGKRSAICMEVTAGVEYAILVASTWEFQSTFTLTARMQPDGCPQFSCDKAPHEFADHHLQQVIAQNAACCLDEWGSACQIHYQRLFYGVQGDVNGNGLVNAVDVQLVINAALGIPLEPGYSADINGDSLVNAVDVQLVINAALGIEINP